MSTVIQVENLSKQYRLGLVGSGTFKEDASKWWAKIRRKEDPFKEMGEENDRTKVGSSNYVWSLKDINFDVQQGDVLGIVGRNGAGKSTLLKILSKVTSPTTGTIKAKGRIASLLEVGTGFHPELTGRENIYLNGAILGMRRQEIKSKLDEIIAFAGVERYIDTPVKRYSSGMYVRLAFAVAAHLENEILIIDEVLAVGDSEFQKKCLGKMGDVSSNYGRTILFVSHNMSAIQTLCNTAISLNNGKVSQIGNPNDVVTNYILNNSSNNRFIFFDSVEEAIGNEKIKILYAGVENASSQNIKDDLFVNNEINIVFEFVNLTNETFINVGFDLKTYSGDILFGTSTTVECKTNNSKKVTCKIPSFLLNYDSYIIHLYFHRVDFAGMFSVSEFLSFEVLDIDRSNGYSGKINGFFRIKLNWNSN